MYVLRFQTCQGFKKPLKKHSETRSDPRKNQAKKRLAFQHRYFHVSGSILEGLGLKKRLQKTDSPSTFFRYMPRRRPQDDSERLQDAPRRSQDPPETPQDAPETCPRRHPRRSRRPPGRPERFPRRFKTCQENPETSFVRKIPCFKKIRRFWASLRAARQRISTIFPIIYATKRNENETKRNKTRQNATERNKTRQNTTKRDKTRQHARKREKTRENARKRDRTQILF